MYKVFQVLGARKEKVYVETFTQFDDAEIYAGVRRRIGDEMKVERITNILGAFDQFEYETSRG